MTRQIDALVVRALRHYHSSATRLDQQLAARSGLSTSDHRCVDLLDLHGGSMTAGELAAQAGLTTGAVTGVVDRLTRAGVARRVTVPGDRRVVLVELEEAGRARGRALYAAVVDAERAHLAGLDDAELELLQQFLEAEATWLETRAAELATHIGPHRRGDASARGGPTEGRH